MSLIFPYKNILPKIADNVFIAPTASIVGDVEISEQSSVWFNCVIRGDVNYIRIGERTNIQDGTIIHVTRATCPTIIGSDITIGHAAILHGCTLKNKCFVGMGATIMDNACIETDGMLAAGALLTPNKIVKSGELWAGRPAKFMRNLSDKESAFIKISADNYVGDMKEYLK